MDILSQIQVHIMKNRAVLSAKNIFDFRGVKIQFFSEFEGLYDKMQKHIIENNMILIGNKDDNYITASMIFIQSDFAKVEYKKEKKELIVYGKYDDFSVGRALYYILEYYYECIGACISNSLLIHSAAVYCPELQKSILIIGEKGSGKTTVAFKLCKEHKMHLIGNDLVKVGYDQKNELISKNGSLSFTIRETAARNDEDLSIFISLFKKRKISGWNNKIVLVPKELGVKTHNEDAVIDLIVEVRIDNHQKNFVVEDKYNTRTALILHEKVGRHISAQSTPFLDDYDRYLGTLPLIDYSVNSSIRENIVKAMIQKKVYRLSGSKSDNLVEWISEKVKR